MEQVLRVVQLNAGSLLEPGWDDRPFGAELWPDPHLRFGSAVLSRWPIDDAAYHPLPVADGPDDPFVHGVRFELLHVETAGRDVFSCHLAAAATHGRHRRLQVLAIDELIAAARSASEPPRPGRTIDGMPPILCGDFNAEPNSDEIRFLSSLSVLDGRTTFYQDAWRVAGEGAGHTQDWRSTPSPGP